MMARVVAWGNRWRFPLICFLLAALAIVAAPLILVLGVWLSQASVSVAESGSSLVLLVVLQVLSFVTMLIGSLLYLARWVIVPALMLMACAYMSAPPAQDPTTGREEG